MGNLIQYNATLCWVWFSIQIASAVGMVILMHLNRSRRFVGAFVGTACGDALCCLILLAVAASNKGNQLAWWAQILIYLGSIGAGMVLGYFMERKDVVIIGTSVVGGIYFIYGWGSLIGQYPYAYYETSTWVFWIYFTFSCLSSFVGLVFQCYFKKLDELEEVHEEFLDCKSSKSEKATKEFKLEEKETADVTIELDKSVANLVKNYEKSAEKVAKPEKRMESKDLTTP